ncbi:hypothetical protein ACIA5D_13670 [Actinoplanes sp. NPDC051513]|uniref:hypothetical protein n=1 Tax=Actinoplanes sp. NPDC051513 TaxID=3363908 RepID=UPI0037AA4473
MTTQPGSPVDRLLTASLIFAPLVYLLVDCLYAARGWDDGAAGFTHVLGATAYAFVFLRLVTWSDRVMAAVLLVVAVLGTAGNVGYGFNTIHVSLGDTDLVDASGAAVLIKPLGLLFPLSILLAAWALRRIAPPWRTVTLAVAAVAWPVAHIANIAWLAVLVNVALVVAFGAIAIREMQPAHSRPGNPRDVREAAQRPA